MNDPKRLVAESHSMLAHELLNAAQSERVPHTLQQRMAEGLAITLGVSSIGAGLALGGSAQAGVQSGIAAAQSTAMAAGEVSVGGAAGFGTAAIGASNTAAIGGATLAQGATWVSSAVWFKGVLAVCALTGAVGLGSVAKQWLDPSGALTNGAAPNGAEPNVAQGSGAERGIAVPDAVEPRVAESGDTQRIANVDIGEPSGAEVADQGKATRRTARSKSKGAASESPTTKEPSGDLGREVRMLDAARRAIIAGDIGAARERLAQYSRAFPNGSLRAEAASLAKAAANAQ